MVIVTLSRKTLENDLRQMFCWVDNQCLYSEIRKYAFLYFLDYFFLYQFWKHLRWLFPVISNKDILQH